MANLTYYLSDYYVNAQFCNSTTGDCTPISGWSLANAYLPQLALSDAQFITALRIISTIQFLTTYLSVHSRGASASASSGDCRLIRPSRSYYLMLSL